MKYVLMILVTLSMLNLYGQEMQPIAEGKVSYITLQNIYVKFETSGLVQPGDTVFIRKDQGLIPLFVTESVSSLSCVGKPIAKTDIKVSDIVVIRIKKIRHGGLMIYRIYGQTGKQVSAIGFGGSSSSGPPKRTKRFT